MEIPAGTVFANLTVIAEVERSGYNRRFLCRCVCGTETTKFIGNLRLGRSTSCGCTYEVGSAGRAHVAAERRLRAMVSESGRICLTCDRWLPWSEFSTDKRRPDGHGSNCIECARWRTVLALLGLTRTEWEWLSDSQDGLCALCAEPEHGRRLAVDHDHTCCPVTKACKKCIRGLLCQVCNRMVGLVETKTLVRARFTDYLDRRPFLSVPTGCAEPVLEDVM